jgi:Ca-activated chloride channel family protein
MSGKAPFFRSDRIHLKAVRLLPTALLAASLLICGPPGSTASDAEPKVTIVPRPAHPQSARERRSATIRLDVKTILVPVSVTDSADRPVEGLRKQDFQIFEDNVKQEIVSSTFEDAPASVGLIFDASGSMGNKIHASADAVDQFFKTTLPGDEFLLVRFSDKPQFTAGFTPDIDEISRWIHSTHPSGWTALNDAICLGIQKMKTAKNPRRVLLVLSDGGDNNSRYSTREIRELVREAGVSIYAVSFFQGSRLLESISTETGGHLIRLRHVKDLPDAMERLSREIRSQYVLSYYSSNPQNDGKYRRVRVELSHPDLRVSWRHGYYAPLD